MKHNGVFSVSVAYVGCFLGAGFVSGQELWQFFGAHGPWGYLGMLLSTLLFFGAGVVILNLAKSSGESATDRLVVWFENRPLRLSVLCFEGVFLFVIYLLMAASMGALTEQLLGISPLYGSAVFCVLATLLSLSGIRGIVRFFSALVPALVLFTVILSVSAVLRGGSWDFSVGETAGIAGNHFLLDSVTYVTYNIFCSIPILGLLGKTVTSKKTVFWGIFLGCLYLFLLMGGILLAMATDRSVTLVSLPMVKLAFSFSRVVGIIYTLLLAFSVLGAGLSSMCGLNASFIYHSKERKRSKKSVVLFATGLSALAFLGSVLGFRELVGVVYPILGYVGIVPLAMLIVHAVLLTVRNKRKS